jgi:nitrite reductase (NADH) small subunit
MALDQSTGAAAGEWLYICEAGDIPALGARVVERNKGAAVALFRNAEDKVFALLDRCPHKGGPLSQGIVHGEQVTCPLHSFNIALGSGLVQAPDEGCASSFAVKREGEAIYLKRSEVVSIGIDDGAGAPQPIALSVQRA